MLRVAAVQLELRAEPDLGHFAAHVAAVVAQAARAGAELVVLPELASTGLLASDPDASALRVTEVPAAYRRVFPPCVEPIADVLRELATTHGLTVLGGSHYRQADDGTYRNTALLAHADGRVERQDKLHLTPQEQAMGTTPGDEVLVTRVGPATVAIQICADVEFPEVSRHLALRGVDLVLCPSLTWNRRGAQRIRYSTHARALENQLFVVTAPLVGSCGVPVDGAIHGTGTALVAAPIDRTFGLDDGVVAEHDDTRTEGMVVADLDLDLIAASRAALNRRGCRTCGRTCTHGSPPRARGRQWWRGRYRGQGPGRRALGSRMGRHEDGLHRPPRHRAPHRVRGHGPGGAGPPRRRGQRGGRARLPGRGQLPARQPPRRDPGHPQATDRPFAVNLLVPPTLVDPDAASWDAVEARWRALAPEDRAKLRGVEAMLTSGAVQGQVEVVLDERPAAVVLTFDVPGWFISACHERDMRVLALVGSVPRAEQAAAAGVDVVVAQGTEGGGHTGHIGTMALLPGVVDAVAVPVLAAGGIVDGRGLAAARCLGAAGRGWAPGSSPARRPTATPPTSSGWSRPPAGTPSSAAPTRGSRCVRWRTPGPAKWTGRTAEIQPFPAQYAVAGVRVETGYQDGDVEEGMMPAGQGVQQLRSIEPAGDIVREVVADAESVLRVLSAGA